MREAIIYKGKSTIKINEVKEHLLNKDEIDKQLTGESHCDDSGQVHFSNEKSNNESYTGNLKHKNLMCNLCHKKGNNRVDYWTRKKKQPNNGVIELAEGDEKSATFYLLQTDWSVTKING